MTSGATIAVVIISIIFVIFAPLVIFGYSTKPIFYEPNILDNILNNRGFFDSISPPQMGNDIISVSQAQAFSSTLSRTLPQMLAYLRGETDDLKIILKTDALKAAVITSVRENLDQKLSEPRVCNQDEKAQFISMTEFTCMPISGQEKEIVVNMAMSQISEFLNLNEIQDIDLSDQVKQSLDSLSPIKKMVNLGFKVLEIITIVLALLLLSIIGIRRSWKACKTIGILLIWVGISTYIIAFAIPVVLKNMVTLPTENSVITGVVTDILTVITGNAQVFATALAIIGIILIITYFYVGKEFQTKKSNVKKRKNKK